MTEESKGELSPAKRVAVAAATGLAVSAMLHLGGVGPESGPEFVDAVQAIANSAHVGVADVLNAVPPAVAGAASGAAVWLSLNLRKPFVGYEPKGKPRPPDTRRYGGNKGGWES